MSAPCGSLCRLLFLTAAVHAVGAAHATGGVTAKVGPSDCRPRDADSTCATAVAGVPITGPLPINQVPTLYDGTLAGVPPIGYSYWGFDFFADETGMPSLVRPDEFINRSSVPVTITLSFDFPTSHPCNKDCLPGVQFMVDPGWFKLASPYTIAGNQVSVSQTFAPGRGYGWVLGLWQATNPRLTVTIPKDAVATLEQVGMSAAPSISTQIPAVTGTCTCSDGTLAACSAGGRFSNGLLGDWYQGINSYGRVGAFTSCPPER